MNRHVFKICVVFIIATFILMPYRSASSAQVEEKPPLKIVHLGDSYSAGNGARSDAGNRNYYGIEGCYRSHTNWGEQFADSLGDTYAVQYINRACSGGVIENILNPRIMEYVPKDPFSTSCPRPLNPDEENIYLDEINPEVCIRDLDPQIEAIDESVDLVIMTMGGNDVEFDRIVVECFVPGPGLHGRDPAGCREAVEDAKIELPNVKSGLIQTFEEIRERLRPDARVVFVTYPYLTPDVDYRLNNTRTNDTYEAAREIRALGLEGDNQQREAVEEANQAARNRYGVTEDYIIFFDSTKALFEGHEPDPDPSEVNPNAWLHEFVFSLWYYDVETYHFNPLGHQNLGDALSPFETFGVVPSPFDNSANIDVAFVVDTTGSMGDDIAQVQEDLSSLVEQLANTTDTYRVAVVSYRDFPERTGWSGDYPFRVDQTFTNDLTLIQAAIDSLTADGGGDGPETVFSGIQASIELPWRPGVTKIAIVIGDAPALSPEPISDLTASQIIANSIAVDPVQVVGVNTGSLNSNGAVGEIANGTGGSVIQGTSGLTAAISEILDQAANQPFAWIGQAYSGKIGEPIQFDASGSYDPSGLPLTLYEWDFDGDGIFDLQTQEAITNHIYPEAFNDYVVLRVTGQGGTALASARTVVNDQGYASQGDEDSCELDENGYSIILDEQGRFIPCRADSLPESDEEGVSDNLGNSPPSLPILENQFVQYSDPLSFTLSATDPDDPSNTLVFTAAGLPNDLIITDNGDGTATVSGTANVAPNTYTAQITVTDPSGLFDTKPVSIIVSKEDAYATYTGPMLVSTSSVTSSTATIPLRATIQDITAVDSIGDPDPGNITNATVSFVRRDNNTVLCNANVVLLDPAVQTVGSATCNWSLNIGSSSGVDYTIGIVVDGYYTRNSPADDTVIVISKPVSNFITGGGYFINESSGGTYAGDPDANTNFGLTIKFTRKLTNLQGRVTIIVRHNGRVYQIKSNALNSLVTVPYDPARPRSGTAELFGRANFTDVTDPLNPVSVASNATLNVVMKDNGEPGNADLISISLWSRDGTLLFSSNWDGVETIQQLLNGGNLSIK